MAWGDFAWEIVAARNVWSKKGLVLLILMFLIGILVRMRSILEDCEMIPFLYHVCSRLLDFLARSARLWRSIIL